MCPPRSRLALWLLVAGWVYLLFFHALGRRDLWNSHEARAAMNAQSILDDGEWLLPTLNDGTRELQKPPLYYWMVATLGSLTGGEVVAWAVRLPSALSGVLCLVILVVLARRSGRPVEGWLAALVLATAIHFTWLARVGRIDMLLTLATTAALAGFYLGLHSPRRLPWLLVAYSALGIAVLLKGPVGVVLVAAAGATFLVGEWLLSKTDSPRVGLGLWWGVPLVLAIALPWFLAANEATDGEFFRVFFWHHNVERGLGGSRLRGHPWWFYGPQFILDFAPWSLLVPLAIVYFLRGGRWREDREARLGLAWFLSMAVVLSCARYKRADYLVPAYPGAALFLGCVIRRWWKEPEQPLHEGSRIARRLTVGLMLVAAVAWWVRVDVFLPFFENRREHRAFAEVIRRYAPHPEEVVLFHMEAHALAHHLGKPLSILLHWHELEAMTHPCGVVMPAKQAAVWQQHLKRVTLERLASNVEGHEKPVVLFRLHPSPATTNRSRERATHAGTESAAADRQRSAQPGAAGSPRRRPRRRPARPMAGSASRSPGPF